MIKPSYVEKGYILLSHGLQQQTTIQKQVSDFAARFSN
jgi:hypothetical protein